MLSAEQLHAIMPKLSEAKGLSFLPFLQTAIAEFAIEAPARSAAFLSQVAHESGQFRFMEEIWGPTPAQRRYEPPSTLAARLGNTDTGDGKRFKGRGPIQITGRANYRRFGDLLGLDLVADPGRAAMPEVAFRIAGLFWRKNGLNELADQATADAFRLITRRINGGLNGLADREQFYAVARTVLGVPDVRVERGRAVPASPSGEPTFERGDEAVRAVTSPRSRMATPAKKKRKTKSKARTTKRRPKTKPATTASAKTPARPKLRGKTTVRRSGRSQQRQSRAEKQSTSRRRSRAKSKR
jgi:putative chitinase